MTLIKTNQKANSFTDPKIDDTLEKPRKAILNPYLNSKKLLKKGVSKLFPIKNDNRVVNLNILSHPVYQSTSKIFEKDSISVMNLQTITNNADPSIGNLASTPSQYTSDSSLSKLGSLGSDSIDSSSNFWDLASNKQVCISEINMVCDIDEQLSNCSRGEETTNENNVYKNNKACGIARNNEVDSYKIQHLFKKSQLFIFQKWFALRNSKQLITKNFEDYVNLYENYFGESLKDDSSNDSNSKDSNDDKLDSYRINLDFEEPSGQGNDKTSTLKSFLLLLKSFIGTGILFLPNAFNNGGLLFSIVMIILFGIYSYWCYYILIKVKNITGLKSFGDMGKQLYGSWMKFIILFSLILTQLGFACAYVIFTAESFKSFIQNVTGIKNFNILYPILFQLAVFIPMSFIRNVSKLTTPSLLANSLIMAGIVLVIYYSFNHLIIDLNMVPEAGVIKLFNPDHWTLFVGTAIFAFEGIGLIIPVQDTMKKPQDFPLILGLVIICTTILFIIVATAGYLAYGSLIETVILQNFPQKNLIINLIQLFYSLAILLSTPLQIFPAISIIEGYIFSKKPILNQVVSSNNDKDTFFKPINISGRDNWKIKWLKNLLRSLIVIFVIALSYFQHANLDKLVAIVGSFACIPLVYMYPQMLHLKSYSIPKSKGKPFPWRVIIDYLLIVFGGISMIYTSYQSIST